MISYFIKTGGTEVANFSDYIWRERGFATILEKHLADKNLGNDLKLVLIKFLVDGEIITFSEIKKTISTFDENNKEISIDIHVRKNQFWTETELKRKSFIIQSTIDAIKLISKKLSSKKMNFNFEKLIEIIDLSGREFLKLDSNKAA